MDKEIKNLDEKRNELIDEIDKQIKTTMQFNSIKFVEFSCLEQEKILKYILEKVEK